MATPQQTPPAANRLLTTEEREICTQIMARDISLISQRAAALLSIDSGMTQAQTVEKTGLSLGQVRYLITTFRKKGMGLFPDSVLVETPAEVVEDPVKAVEEPTEEVVAEPVQSKAVKKATGSAKPQKKKSAKEEKKKKKKAKKEQKKAAKANKKKKKKNGKKGRKGRK